MGTGHQKDQVMIRHLELFTLTPHIPERKEGLEMGLSINHADIMKLS